MAWEARSGLKLEEPVFGKLEHIVGMAWEARSGLKLGYALQWHFFVRMVD
jgi:hypothetical protein